MSLQRGKKTEAGYKAAVDAAAVTWGLVNEHKLLAVEEFVIKCRCLLSSCVGKLP